MISSGPSFNLAGEPIVPDVAQGYSTFRRSDIALLVVGDQLVAKRTGWNF